MINATVIVASDRVVSGERDNSAGELAATLLRDAGLDVADPRVLPEGRQAVSEALADARSAGHRVIVTVGGTGLGPRNLTPEATAPHIAVELTGLMTQVLLAGLANTEQAGLSRGIIGLTGRGSEDALIVNVPSSRGGVRDALGVVCPLLPNIFERLDRGD
ncbi:molybdenum cofactor synthesis domain-containing protein [Corynebacterium pollutisoli]|uniref:Molybdenum cofactor synthesis domain-containing protein n=2 Tax=Corynebacterium pollutisoli TaxID=1610489 RepID=A0A1X7JMQ1_9CORY|nr:molybdopterin-binding protein [Corynebacterium pollutisoli]SMG28703.1 molybdenum cofactor synthesis domain-containing protein [Corynebacterium pollutisoli]HJD78639.1 MogA/MoaB family molybdenum cofactor biosynthesis protein [Corynebacterium pollutisoli]